MNPFDLILINPFLNVLIAIYKVLLAAHVPGALGLAIIAMTLIIRLILWPLTSTQLKSSQKMAQLKPHLDRLKKDHGHDKTRHQQEVSKLYKDHGVNPLAGCLPILLQIPVFIALYQVLLKIINHTQEDFLTSINDRIIFPALHLDKVPNTNFIGFDLANKPSEWQQLGFVLLAVPLITGVLQFIQSKMMSPQKVQSNKPVKKEEKKADSMEDTMSQMQTQMIFIMPAMIAFFSYGFPLGLSLYWNTFTIVGIIQQYKIVGSGSLTKYLPESLRKPK